MIARTRALELRSLARDILNDHDLMRLPVRPKELAEKLEIVVQAFEPETPDISGFLMQMGDSFGIGYSTAIKNKGFQNFTIAHELGHYLIDGHPLALLENDIHYSRSGYISKDKFEQEADTFATEFLMPWKLIDPVIRQSVPGFAAIKNLSENCESSLLASAIRYTEVTKENVAVVVSYRGAVEFMTASTPFLDIPGIDWLRRRDSLPDGVPSKTWSDDLASRDGSFVAEEGTNLRRWFLSAPDLEIEEDVVGLGSYGRILTVLIADYDSDQGNEESEDEDDYIARWKEGRHRK